MRFQKKPSCSSHTAYLASSRIGDNSGWFATKSRHDRSLGSSSQWLPSTKWLPVVETRVAEWANRSQATREPAAGDAAHRKSQKDAGYRAALITGSSSGIGASFAKILPATTDLALSGRNTARLNDTAERLRRPGRRVITIAADLATREGRLAVIEGAESLAVDLFVCNAGLGSAGRFAATTLESVRETIDVNVVATTELLHAVVPAMIARAKEEQRRGGIIIVSSIAAFSPGPEFAVYGATKAFQLRLTQALAAELKDEPLDVLLLCPTYTDTEFFERSGMPSPIKAMPAEDVAREAMAALGRRSLHLCGLSCRPQVLRQMLAFNPAFAALRNWRALLR